ncbi:hypothetical protein J4453_00025 [Candidatus Woesearchaeota archaeon]|nr:hypothetical protein [Candidatus Woesearchaeota archaeon]
MVEYIEGILKIANLILSVVAGYIALSLFRVSHQRIELRPWKLLIIGLVFFAVQEILGALRAFRIYTSAFLTHIVPTIILGFILAALVMQIYEHRRAGR